MGRIMEIITIPLNSLMRFCYNFCGDYVLAIVVFTLLTKIILMPVVLWIQRSSIKMVEIMPDLNRLKVKYFGDKDTIAEETQTIYKQKGYHPLASTLPMIVQIVLLMGVIEAVKALLGDSDSVLLQIPAQKGGLTLLMPIAAGLAALLLTLAQNKIAPLQKEQPKAEQLSTGLVSVGISLFLGAFVSLGTGVYWIASNLFSIPVQVVCNWIINPKKYVDYEALEASRKELAELEGVGGKKKESFFSENRKRERADYKHFFSVANKHLVFYSESSGFYKYYKGIIEYLLDHTNLTIHYITSDPNDAIFELAKTRTAIRPYYIGEKKLITLMMKMDADMVVMTMPDLENYHIKRSYIRKDIEYVYIPHGMDSLNLTMRKGSVDHYDTVFCVGPHQVDEIRETEKAYGLPQKNLFHWGYTLLDEMRSGYSAQEHRVDEKPNILIAPSWQPENIVDNCLESILDGLSGGQYTVTVRPHPQEVRHKPERMEALKSRYAGNPDITIQTDFSSNSTVFDADLMITDWSGIAFEYAFTTCKPVLFIDTPMKVMNPEYEKINVVPLNIQLRNEIGCSMKLEQLDGIAQAVERLLREKDAYTERIAELARTSIYNQGQSAAEGAKEIVRILKEKTRKDGE